MIQHNHDLEILKQMAMADGILTENEKELFRSYFQLTDKEAEDLFQSIEAELECVQSETEVINWKRKNGIDFEKCIVKMLNPQYYTLQEWTGDKFIDGRFCEANCNPDIICKSYPLTASAAPPSPAQGEGFRLGTRARRRTTPPRGTTLGAVSKSCLRMPWVLA